MRKDFIVRVMLYDLLMKQDANKGMLFDGRFAEDFKLNTGTWVRVGMFRSQIIAAGKGLIQDAVITGHDNDFIGAIVFPDLNIATKIAEQKMFNCCNH